ncbi:GNAT family N-acetyltransferase [Clostridium sp. D2Q-14]|uniref:GNAT family N-acetyltransferase n=1 Tax=Anaeromonas gelatinilytica TaxID=2683194 RepID=UPI00193AF078|nr:GNAT family N-acetyltransferase [Anaeromonas gelatinilytica]MBS4535733.1 GNAT family N-acetyltransferase [Anaeromonas gelatinilytica]
MYCLKKEDMFRIIKFFDGWNDTLLWSCLQGYMGNAWTDDIRDPRSVQIIIGDFCFFAGVPNIELVKNIPEYFSAQYIFMIPENDKWANLIKKEYKNNYERFMRYAIKKEPDVFNIEKLCSYIEKLPLEYSLRKIDREIYNKVKTEEWSKDLCSQFPSYNYFEKYGLGFVVYHNDKIVSGASSYTVYNEGIEIEIDTREEYRRKGLALACASKLILECLNRGLYPSWDAANRESVALAEKLGYHFEKEYATYSITL